MPIEIGSEVEGKVTGITNYGAFIDLGGGAVGLVHISQIADSFVTDIKQHLKVGDVVKVKVMASTKDNKFDLSIKQVGKANLPVFRPRRPAGGGSKDKPIPGSFEDKITQFLKVSEERLLDLKRNLEGKQGGKKKKRVK
ncbi:S1 RNA-binding domain-containing protein [Candidatus Saganbacteria bacterium]|nr:S1 RNA-binding domain-containing protein [Candidatus Saganbacteria bacterium]